jgi:CheY-like chemotaxis protein
VYGIVKQHQGIITVYSEPDMGTTFHIYFPLARAAPASEEPVIEEIERGTETILLAEDSDDVRRLIKEILIRYGYRVIEARDGSDAMEKYGENRKRIDLLILDSVMPGKNGRAVYDEIRRTNPFISVLFMSGYTKDIVLDKGIEDKRFAFISKPVTPSALLKKVRQVLDE